MTDPDEFDAFYKGARSALLLQTYALTGDLSASRSAVRDSFVVAWHHWRKVQRMAEPEAYVRSYAWQHAQRRHTARLWHRDKGLDPESRATLDALGKLPVVQRKALLMTQLTTVSLAEMAREVGLPRAEAERQLQLATSQFAVHRDVPSTSLRSLLDSLRLRADQTTWPRPSIIRRAGAARRRSHTLVGAAASVAALLVSGMLVTDPAGARPSLDGGRPTVSSSPEAGQGEAPAAAPKEFSGEMMLSAEQVDALVPGRRWRERRTTDNTEGNGLVLPCQQTRYADPKGVSALVREFGTTTGKRAPQVSATQTAELSASRSAARRAQRTTLDWFAGCNERRFQLLATRAVDNVGDDATMLVLRSWQGARPTVVVGVARTGRLTSTTFSTTTSSPDLRGSARLLAAAVNGLCTLPDAGECATMPRLRNVPPIPAAAAPGMLAEVDLRPVGRVRKPWIGTEPRTALDNDAATPCDRTSFNRKPVSHNLTRTFLIPDAKLAAQFGLTETVGTLRAGPARAFVRGVADRIARCGRRDLGSEVTRLADRSSRQRELTAWRVTTELSDARSVTFLMGVVRNRTAVAQVGFVPSAGVTMRADDFVALLERAGARLAAMPPPR